MYRRLSLALGLYHLPVTALHNPRTTATTLPSVNRVSDRHVGNVGAYLYVLEFVAL